MSQDNITHDSFSDYPLEFGSAASHSVEVDLADTAPTAAPDSSVVSRRTFLAGSAAVGAAVGAALTVNSAAAQSLRSAAAQTASTPAALLDVRLNVNGVARPLKIEPRVSLLDALREQIGLTGTKKGCNQGACGACTVLVDGVRINSCLTLAVMHQGQAITTIEGLAQGEQLHPMQAAFIEHDGFQCGYCTSGQILSAVACIREGHADTDREVREWMSGNLCRCGCYNGIVAAIRDVVDGDRASV